MNTQNGRGNGRQLRPCALTAVTTFVRTGIRQELGKVQDLETARHPLRSKGREGYNLPQSQELQQSQLQVLHYLRRRQ